MKLRLLTTALLAMAGAAIMTQNVSAATLSYAAGDLLIGFHETGVASDYVIDIGPASSITAGMNLTNVGADLTAVFGANWATSGVSWGIVGGTTTGASTTLWSSKAETTNGTQSTPWVRQTNSVETGAYNEINAVGNAYAISVQTTEVNAAGLIQATSATNSYASFQTTTSFGIWSPSNEGTVSQDLDVYQLVNRSGTNQGPGVYTETFAIDSTGEISTTPEPSTYALMILGGFFLFWGINRRKNSALIA